MARSLQSGQVTPADELRELLSTSEKLVASVRGSGAGVLVLLENMDRLSELWPELEAAGVDLRPEAGRWETLQATVRRNGRRLVRELRPHAGCQPFGSNNTRTATPVGGGIWPSPPLQRRSAAACA